MSTRIEKDVNRGAPREAKTGGASLLQTLREHCALQRATMWQVQAHHLPERARVLNDIRAAQPYYRFNILSQKASELATELKSLGSALLSALEKRDAEDISLLRSKHELSVLKLVESIKKRTI